MSMQGPQMRQIRRVNPNARQGWPAAAQLVASAYAHAAAKMEAVDALRPNACYGLHPTPGSLGTKVTAGQATACSKITLEAGTTICGVYADANDSIAGFTLVSFRFGSNEVVKSPPMHLSTLSDNVMRTDRLIALIGHKLPSALDVNATVFVGNSADQYFRGISILCIDGTCRPVSSNAAPAPGFTGFIRVVPALRKALAMFGPRPIVR
jgi:hypothetical protein